MIIIKFWRKNMLGHNAASILRIAIDWPFPSDFSH